MGECTATATNTCISITAGVSFVWSCERGACVCAAKWAHPATSTDAAALVRRPYHGLSNWMTPLVVPTIHSGLAIRSQNFHSLSMLYNFF